VTSKDALTLVKYLIFSLGCSLIAKGDLMLPEPMSWGTNAFNATMLDIQNPKAYLKLLKILFWLRHFALIANVVVGIVLFSWWPGTLLWLPATVVVGIFRPRKMELVFHVVGFGILLVLIAVSLMLIH
jgi:hypothetical protein